jgi:hypothetical protein
MRDLRKGREPARIKPRDVRSWATPRGIIVGIPDHACTAVMVPWALPPRN